MEVCREQDEKNPYEYPLPMIQVSVEEIAQQMRLGSVFSGAFRVSNKGGGILQGKIWSKTEHLEFNPTSWCGNDQVIMYRMNTEGLKVGDLLHSVFIVSTTGGEVQIPIELSIIPTALYTEDGVPIETLHAFSKYTSSFFVHGKELFQSPLFFIWLQEIEKGKWIPIYEHLMMDPNKERALENFLVLTGAKQKNQISLLQQHTYVDIEVGNIKPIEFTIPLQKQGWGYIEGKIETDLSWIGLPQKEFSAKQFEKTGAWDMPFSVLPQHLSHKQQLGHIMITVEDQELYHEVKVKKLAVLDIKLSKKSFHTEDKGKVMIHNYTGKDLLVEMVAQDRWIQFDAKKYFIGKYAEIPFQIQFGNWNKFKRNIAMGKIPLQYSTITIQTKIHTQVVRQIIDIKVGSLLS